VVDALGGAMSPARVLSNGTRTLGPLAVLIAGAVALLPMSVPASGQCPQGMARIADRYCIDRYEAALVEVQPDGGEQPWSPYHSPERARVRAISRRGVVPQGYINEIQADRACRAAGKRLCNNAEWTLACQGPARRQFPYGNQRQSGQCNDGHRRHPVVQLYGQSRMYIWGGDTMNDPQINQLPGTVALTGAFESCANEFGVFDMVGNLHEWIDDPNGTFRGGYYMDTRLNGDGCAYRTSAHNVSYRDYSTGFRCCSDIPEG
jgi:formylglycine-generating enzyme